MTLCPVADFSGSIVVFAPHMDDESLGCGLLLATRQDKARVHVVFVTDGSRSPEPVDSRDAVDTDLASVRRQEALEATAVLGVPSSNVHFLNFADGSLAHAGRELADSLIECVRRLCPRFVFVPFRFDRHPDHIAINHAVCSAKEALLIDAEVLEYFVYHRWRLLPKGDVRAYIVPSALRHLGPPPEWATRLKRQAIACHRTQTTHYFDWQSRPILTAALIDRVCVEPETYLSYDSTLPGRQVFTHAAPLIALAHRIEPPLKRLKDRLARSKLG